MQILTQPVTQPAMSTLIRPAIGLSLIALIVCGFGYSAIATKIGQAIFPEQAHGSLIKYEGKVVGSKLVAQPFTAPSYFHSRPSVANYDPMALAGSNLARTNPELQKVIAERIVQVASLEAIQPDQIPKDLVTASGSGIDPEISVQAALIQVKRIAEQRSMPEQQVRELVLKYAQQPTFGVLGSNRVNVLELNLALDQLKRK